MDSPERAKCAVKSNSGLRVYRELGRGSRGARGIYLSRSLFPQKTPGMGVFCYNGWQSSYLGSNSRHGGTQTVIRGKTLPVIHNLKWRPSSAKATDGQECCREFAKLRFEMREARGVHKPKNAFVGVFRFTSIYSLERFLVNGPITSNRLGYVHRTR